MVSDANAAEKQAQVARAAGALRPISRAFAKLNANLKFRA